jgi:hypothetical protein
MVLALPPEQLAAIQKRQTVLRRFLWCEARDPITGAPAPAGFWNGTGTVTVSGRDYHGSGTLARIESQPSRSDFTIPGLQITLSGISVDVTDMVRGKSVGQAPITVYLGIFDTDTRALIGNLIPRFVGRIDDVEIKDPQPNGTCDIVFTLESDSRALTISRPDKRVQEDQLARAADTNEPDIADDFYLWASSAREARIYFGLPTPRTAKHKSPKNDS